MWIRMSPLTCLPPELLTLIITQLRTSRCALAALSRTCHLFHTLTTPILFSIYERRVEGDDIRLIHFARSLLLNPVLGPLVKCVSIDDSGYISPARPRRERGWEYISGRERGVTWIRGRGGFVGEREKPWGSFVALTEGDWGNKGLMTAREWKTLEGRVGEVCKSAVWMMGGGKDVELSAVEVGRKEAYKVLGQSWTPLAAVEGEGENREEKFKLRIIDRGEEDWWHDTDADEIDGWRLNEIRKSNASSRSSARFIAKHWTRALRCGSRDAWSALLLVLATGTQKLVATGVNWYARPDPQNCGVALSREQREEVEKRYDNEDDDWDCLGGYTWVGRVMRQCAAGQTFAIVMQEVRKRQPVSRARSPPRKRRRMDHGLENQTRQDAKTEILRHLREIVVGSSPNPSHHTNLSLNTVLHFLQPPWLRSATVIGLTNCTFGHHERKPPMLGTFSSGLKSLHLLNCDATAEVLGYLLSFSPKLTTLCHRAPLRTIYRPAIIPGLVPGELVPYLAEYCKQLQILDLDPGNKYEQHGFECWNHEARILDMRGLERLEMLWCRVEHLCGSDVAYWDGPMSGAKKYLDDLDKKEGRWRPVVLREMLPRGLLRLVVGVDNKEYENVLEPLCEWIKGMNKGPGVGSKLQVLILICGNPEVEKAIVTDKRFVRLETECAEAGIRLGRPVS